MTCYLTNPILPAERGFSDSVLFTLEPDWSDTFFPDSYRYLPINLLINALYGFQQFSNNVSSSISNLLE